MNLIRYFLVALLAMVLTACGGGGGSAGNPGGIAPVAPVVPVALPLFTTAPASLTTSVGAAQEFSITGGSSPYSVVSDDAAVVTAGVNGSKLTIGGIASGVAIVLIRDAVGAAVSVNVTVRGAALRELFTTAASNVVVSVGLASAQTYNVGGGTAPYTATSSNASVAAAVLTGNNLTVIGLVAGSANILIRDSVGASTTVAVTVQPVSNLALFTTAPASVTVIAGAAPIFAVGGGTGPYTATSSNANVATVSLSGGTLTITSTTAGSANIVIRDSAGASTAVAVTVQPLSNLALFTTAPASVTVIAGAAPTYSVGGGTGPYTATSSSTSVATASLSGNTLTIASVIAGNADIVVRDSVGASTLVAVTVRPASNAALFTTAPASVTVAVGATPAYSIGGGTGPYTATSSNISVATVSVLGSTLQVNGVFGGIANIVLRDSANASVTLAVTVQPASNLPLFTTAPASITVVLSAAPIYTVGGGASPYTATSSNTNVATASVLGNTLTVSGISGGSANIVVRDSAGALTTVTVTVQSANILALFTTAPAAITVASGTSPTYSVGGGTGPYIATSSNTNVATASVLSNTLTVTGISGGSANIVVRDSAGALTTVAVTVQVASNVALFTTAPAAITVASGTSPTYSVGGGTAPYIATSSNINVATASVLVNTLTVSGISGGSANIVVRDSAGALTTVAVTVQVASNVALFTTAPTSLTVAIGNSPVYTVGGGSGSGYVAISSNVGVATVNLAGTNLTVTGVAVGSANVVVRDSAGATVTFSVVVGAIPLAITPGGATGIINDILIATITGGTPPYRASVGNVLVATAVVQNSNELRVTLLQVGQTIATVLDANNQSVAFTLISNAATPGIRLSPGAVIISEFDNQPIVFTVFGTAAGVVNAFSSDVTVLNATVAADNRTVTITTGSKGNRCVGADLPVTITVIDSTRATGVATVTVKDNGGVCP